MIQGMMGMFSGMPVFVDPNLPRFKFSQFRFPRSKGKRIRNKWAKKQENFKQVPIRQTYVFQGGKLIMHPDDFAKLRHN